MGLKARGNTSKSTGNKKPKGNKRKTLKLPSSILGTGLARDAADKLKARDRRIRDL